MWKLAARGVWTVVEFVALSGGWSVASALVLQDAWQARGSVYSVYVNVTLLEKFVLCMVISRDLNIFAAHLKLVVFFILILYYSFRPIATAPPHHPARSREQQWPQCRAS